MLNAFKKNQYIFSDFDGTISKQDVIANFIANFAKGDTKTAEDKWSKGEISTEECMNIQFGRIKGLKPDTLSDFLNSIEIDPCFIEFYKLILKLNKKIIILSDGCDYFINFVLKKYGIFDIPVFSNHLEFEIKNGFLKFKINYPNVYKKCEINSGTCKCEVARRFSLDYTYIGDGLSDRCIAKKSTLLFAKKSLETFCKKEKINYFPYKTFQDIINAIKEENFNAKNDVRFINGYKNQGA